MIDIIAKVNGLVSHVIETPKKRTEQKISSNLCPEMATANIIKEMHDEHIKMMASMQRI